VDELVAIAEGLGAAAVLTTAATARGALLLAEGDPGAAQDQLRRGLTGWRALGLPYEEARTRLLIGVTGRMLGDEEGAQIDIDAARAGLARLGAAEPDATGHDAGGYDVGAPSSRRSAHRLLTDREVEVLQLIAAGKHNREIAAALHLSEHTVARHVQNILAKLGVPSRAAAVSRAVQQRLLGPTS